MPSNANDVGYFVNFIFEYLQSGSYNVKIRINLSKFQFRERIELSEGTRIFHDLGIFGDEADEFLEDMHEKFPFDYSDFVFEDYFPSEFANNYRGLFSIFNRIVPTRVSAVKHLYKPMTVIHLARALQSGVLK